MTGEDEARASSVAANATGTGDGANVRGASSVRTTLVQDSPDQRPLLGAAQLDALRRYGTEVEVAAGDVLFADGDEAYDLIVVLEGRVEIVDQLGTPNETLIIEYGPREFLGEMSLLTGQRVFLAARVSVAGRIVRVSTAQVRVIMAQEPELSELLLRTFLFRHARLTQLGSGLTLVGSRFDVNTRRLLEVLARNRLSFRWLELESSPEAEAMLRQLEVPPSDLPLVVVPGGSLLRNPDGHVVLGALGLVAAAEHEGSQVCDLLVVGAGPAGLSAAVYGASEGMTTMLAEDTALGGQAGTSSRIENYLGFPAGLSGEELTTRGVLQAQKFGVRIELGAKAVGLSCDGKSHQVRFENGDLVSAKSVIIATGARYNRLELERLAEFEGVGVYYAATQMEAQACAGGPVLVVGGGNSAGQAALFLARTCTHVQLAIRGESLASSMSRYLIDEIERDARVTVSSHTEVVSLLGEKVLRSVELRDNRSGQTSTQAICGLFVFIGAKPSTEWLAGQLAKDEDGFLLTGADIPQAELERPGHDPLLLETSRPGVFCVGDVRSHSIKRVATAIGEGSMAVRLVFDRLQATGLAVADPAKHFP
ncbi:MAG: FAD-dependent oxidoreductase [Acidimicrobiales bacterium]